MRSMTAKLLRHFSGKLERLELGATGLDSASVSYQSLNGLASSLRVLDLSDNALDVVMLSIELQSCTLLQQLTLNGLKHSPSLSSSSSIPHSLSSSSVLSASSSSLSLSSSSDFMPSSATIAFRSVLGVLTSLTSLSLQSCDFVENSVVESIATYLGPTLLNLNLSSCPKIGDDPFITLGQKCTKLLQLSLSSCRIGDVAVEAIATGMHKLQSLDLSKCQRGRFERERRKKERQSTTIFFVFLSFQSPELHRSPTPAPN
jgi:hypothetical protein